MFSLKLLNNFSILNVEFLHFNFFIFYVLVNIQFLIFNTLMLEYINAIDFVSFDLATLLHNFDNFSYLGFPMFTYMPLNNEWIILFFQNETLWCFLLLILFARNYSTNSGIKPIRPYIFSIVFKQAKEFKFQHWI